MPVLWQRRKYLRCGHMNDKDYCSSELWCEIISEPGFSWTKTEGKSAYLGQHHFKICLSLRKLIYYNTLSVWIILSFKKEEANLISKKLSYSQTYRRRINFSCTYRIHYREKPLLQSWKSKPIQRATVHLRGEITSCCLVDIWDLQMVLSSK